MKVEKLSEKIIAIYALILTIVGTIGNLACFSICLNKKFRSIPTFVFYMFMLIIDVVSLYIWNLDHFLAVFYGYIIEDLSLFGCTFGTFIQLVTIESSAWTLVKLTFTFR